jgi:hypothetical protein
MRSNLLATAIAVGLGLAAAAPARAADDTAAQLEALKAQLAALQARVDELQTRTDAQSDINIANAKTADDVAATKGSLDKLAKLVNDTGLSGKLYFDVTNIDQTSNGGKTDASGTGFDVKRFYLSVNHKFDDTWSANLTTDFQYSSAVGATELFVKKAYLQGKFSDALTARIGSADMPWIPFAENYYGFRYVENTLTDRLKYGTSADWGVHAAGNLADGRFNYAASVVNGAGYKNPGRGKGVDFEGRIGFAPVDGMVIAVGGYSGKLGKETENTDALHTATRGDLMVAYMNDRFRVGAEYFQASNWGQVLNPLSDKASGYSLWGSVGLGSKATLFARYDQADLSKDLDPSLKDTYFNLGVEFPVRKGIKLAAAYKQDHKRDDLATDIKTREIGMWGEVAF